MMVSTIGISMRQYQKCRAGFTQAAGIMGIIYNAFMGAFTCNRTLMFLNCFYYNTRRDSI
jgi:hypothetical protein